MHAGWLAAAAFVGFTAPAVAQVYVPIPVTGYTQDVIADIGTSAPNSTSRTFDTGYSGDSTGSVLFEQGYNIANPTQGISASGTIVSSASRSYQLGPIAGSNSLQLGGLSTPLSSGTLTLVAPARYAALSVLLASGDSQQPSAGGSTGVFDINWSSGNVSALTYRTYDWFLLSGTPAPGTGVAVSSLGRATRSGTGPVDPTSGTNPVLYYNDFDLSGDPNYLAGAQINSVTFSLDASSAATNIMALSGSVVPIPEPSALWLTAVGFGAIVVRRIRRLRSSLT